MCHFERVELRNIAVFGVDGQPPNQLDDLKAAPRLRIQMAHSQSSPAIVPRTEATAGDGSFDQFRNGVSEIGSLDFLVSLEIT